MLSYLFDVNRNHVKLYSCYAQTATSREKIVDVLQNIISFIVVFYSSYTSLITIIIFDSTIYNWDSISSNYVSSTTPH